MSWRLLLPAMLATARHATARIAPLELAPPPTQPALSNDPSTNPCASSYYYHPLPPPSTSYHWSNSSSPLTLLLRTAILTLVHGFCALHQRLNTLHTHNLPSLHALITDRPPHTALLTLSNHTSTLDDPYIVTALLPPAPLLYTDRNRRSWCADDVCFRRAVYGPFFRLGRVFPVHRGGGLYQTGMTEALSYMVEGGWMHIFPEGKCHPGVGLQRLRWGAAKLLVDSLAVGVDVWVVPIIHGGMEAVMPLHTHIPRVGCEVWLEVGDTVDVRSVVQAWRERERAVLSAEEGAWGDPWPQREEDLYVEVSAVLEAAMRRTEQRLRERMEAAKAQRQPLSPLVG